MFTSIVRELTDRIVDELAPPTTAETDSGQSPRFACLLTSASKVGTDDADILSAIVEVARARNVLDAAQAQLVRTAERAGIPFRKHLRSAKMLLTEIGVPPAVADRTVRNGHHAEQFENVGRGMRDGSMSAEIADAIGSGVARVAARVPLDPGEQQRLARKLALNTTPGEVKTAAKQAAIALATVSDDPDLVPASENPELNEMSLYLNDEGRVEATMDLDVVTGEELNAALDPLCRPVPEPDGSPDPRTARQRRADALGQIIRTYLSGSDRPTSGGVLPHASIVIPTVGSPCDGVARLGFTGPVSPATVALSLCTSAVTRITVDGEGVPLGCGAGAAIDDTRHSEGPRGERLRMRLPRLRTPSHLDRRTPLHAMVRRRRDQPEQRSAAVPDAPHPDPPDWMGGVHRPRRTPVVPRTSRPGTT
ncbi:protein of unknown function [Gordonia malaquae]|nr:protein of unknown function [Gordonia malaquae]